MDDATRRRFLASEEAQARLKADAIVTLTAHAPDDIIDNIDWAQALMPWLRLDSQVHSGSTSSDSD